MKFTNKLPGGSEWHIAFLWAAHIFDAFFTGLGLYDQSVTEVNPVLAHMWGIHPLSFFATKFTLLFICTGVVVHHWQDYRMRYGIYVINVIMFIVCLYEMIGYHL